MISLYSSRLLPMFLFTVLLFLFYATDMTVAQKLRKSFLQVAVEVPLTKKDVEKAREIMKLFQESQVLLKEGKHDAAILVAKRALTIAEKTFEFKRPGNVSEMANNLADIYYQKGDYANAEPLFLRAITLSEKVTDSRNFDFSQPVRGLAKLYDAQGDYNRAEMLFQRALALQEKALGPEHPDIAQALDNLAMTTGMRGNYKRAELLLQRALAIREKALGVENPYVGKSLSFLGAVYMDMADYARAEQSFQRALAMFEKTFGVDSPAVASMLAGLASVYQSKGDYVRAEQLFKRTINIMEKSYGTNSSDVAPWLNSLASLYLTMGEFARAEPLLQRALAIQEITLGPDHAFVAETLTNLAYVYTDKGDFPHAERTYQRALTIVERSYGAYGLPTANVLNNLAGIYSLMDDNTRAEPLYERALAIKEKAMGQQSSHLTSTLINLAQLHTVKGDTVKAVRFLARGTDISEYNLANILTSGSEEQKRLYLATLSNETDSTVSLHVRSAPNDLSATRLALTTILRRKGRALDAMTDQISALRRRLAPQDRALLDQLTTTRSQLATLVLKGAGKSNPSQYRADVDRLETEAGQIEAEISARNAEFRTQTQPVTLERVQQTIPIGAALVEIVSYRPENLKAKKQKEKFDTTHYAAYVLRREGEPAFVELGESALIDHIVSQLRAALSNPKRADVKQVARALDEMVMRPVRKLLGSTQMIFISPDGALNLIPFSALVDEQQRYLVERYSITYLTSGRDLLRLQAQTQGRQVPMVFANPMFDQAVTIESQPAELEDGVRGRRSVSFSQLQFSQLVGTASEAKALKSILPNAQVFTETLATEAALKQVIGPRILHIATHGFFLPDRPKEAINNSRGLSLDKSQQAVRGENPLLRSGLALAGANKRQSGAGEDGILTALETAGLNLWGTKLVVLSACETGVGEVTNGEGVYGLRRALVLAGAESELMSLWQVSDAATRDLMVDYYKRLQVGEGRSEALRQVQLKMLKGSQQTQQLAKRSLRTGKRGLSSDLGARSQVENRSHPFFWASFIPIGDWRNLEAKATPIQ